jgi:hypothetical protein
MMDTDSQANKQEKKTNNDEEVKQNWIDLSLKNSSPALSTLTVSSTPVGTKAGKPIHVEDFPTPYSPQFCGELRLRALPDVPRPKTPLAIYMDHVQDNQADIDNMVTDYLNYNQEEKITTEATDLNYSEREKMLGLMGPMQSTTIMTDVVLNTPDLIQHKLVASIRGREKKFCPSGQILQAIHLLRILNPMKQLLPVPIQRFEAGIPLTSMKLVDTSSKNRMLNREMFDPDKATIASLLCLRSGTELREFIVDSFMFLLNFSNLDDEFVRLQGKILAWPSIYMQSRLFMISQGKQIPNPNNLFTIRHAGVLRETMSTITQRYAYIAFPLVCNGHWVLCVFESLTNTIHYFDSMGYDFTDFPLVKEFKLWLRAVVGSQVMLHIENRDCPRQRDTKMCGVCVCRTVDYLFAKCQDVSILTGICESLSTNTFNTSIEEDAKFRLEMLYWQLIITKRWSFAITSNKDVHTTTEKKTPSTLKQVPTPKRLDTLLSIPTNDNWQDLLYLNKVQALVCALLLLLQYDCPGYCCG